MEGVDDWLDDRCPLAMDGEHKDPLFEILALVDGTASIFEGGICDVLHSFVLEQGLRIMDCGSQTHEGDDEHFRRSMSSQRTVLALPLQLLNAILMSPC